MCQAYKACGQVYTPVVDTVKIQLFPLYTFIFINQSEGLCLALILGYLTYCRIVELKCVIYCIIFSELNCLYLIPCLYLMAVLSKNGQIIPVINSPSKVTDQGGWNVRMYIVHYVAQCTLYILTF